MQKSQQITFSQVNNLIFSGAKIPEDFIFNKSRLNGIVPYLHEQFWFSPHLTRIFGKYFNDLFNIPDPIESIKTIQLLVKWNPIASRFNTWKFFPQRDNKLEEFHKLRDCQLIDSKAALSIHEAKNIQSQTLDKKINIKSKDRKEIVTKALEVAEKEKDLKEQELLKQYKSDNTFLKEINQEIIDELELTLFDIKVLKKTNEILFIFIDVENKKRYYRKGFSFKFYVSKNRSIIYNDYIMSLSEDGDQFIEYITTDHNTLTKFKFALNSAYKKEINLKGGYLG